MSKKRIKMHSKKYIDNLFRDIFYKDPFIRLTVEDIQNSKSSIMNSGITKKVETKFKDDRISKADKTFKDKKFKGKINSKVDKKCQEKITSKAHIKYQDKKKIAAAFLSCINKRKLCADKIDVVKLVSSKKGKTYTPKNEGITLKKFKTSKEDTKFMGNINSEADTNYKEKKKSKDNRLSKGNKTSKQNTNFKVNIKSEEIIKSKSNIKYQDKNKSATDESRNKKLKLCTDKIDVVKLVLSGGVKSDTLQKNKIAKNVKISKTNKKTQNTKKNGKILKKNKTSKNEESPKNNLKRDNQTYPEEKLSNKKLMCCKDKMNYFSKLVLSGEGETDTLQKNKIAKNVKISKTNKKTQDIITHAEEEITNKKQMLRKDKMQLSKLAMSREVESDTSKEEVNTSIDDTMFKSKRISKTGKKTQDIITHSEEKSPNKKLKLCKDKTDVVIQQHVLFMEGRADMLQKNETPIIDKLYKGNKISETGKKTQDIISHAEDESPNKILMSSKYEIDVSKLTLSREFESDKSKEEVNTSKDDTMFKSNKISKTGKKIQYNTTRTEDEPHNKKLRLCKDKMQVCKLAMCREVESDTSKQKGKTSKDNTMFKNNKISKNGKKTIDIISHAEEESPNKIPMSSKVEIDVSKMTLSREVESNTSKEEDKTSKDNTMFNSNKISKTDKKTQDVITHAEDESPCRKMMLIKEEIDVGKLPLPMKVESGTSKQVSKTFNDETMFKSNKISKTGKKTQGIISRAEEESPYKILMSSKDEIDVSKFTLSKEVESDTSKEEDKTSKDNTMFKSNKISKINKKTQDIITHAEEESPNKKLMSSKDEKDVIQQHVLSMEGGADTHQKNEKPKIDTLYKCNNISKNGKKTKDTITYAEEDLPNKKLKLSKDKMQICKLTMSREVVSDTSKEEVNTTKDDTMFKSNKNSIIGKKKQNIITRAEEEPPNKKLKLCKDKTDIVIQQHVLFMEGRADMLQKNETPIIDTLYKGNKISREEYTNTKLKSCKDEKDVDKPILSGDDVTHTFKSQFNTSIRLITKIASTNTEKRSTVTDPEETAVSKSSAVKNEVQRMRVIEPVRMMTKQNLLRWNKFEHFIKLSTIEKLYVKYFTKSIQDTIVTIANILNIILISNKYHQTRIEESFKKRSAAEKLRECCDADQLHDKHKTILETKLKSNFIIVLSSFTESEFDSAFQIFFLSILNVLRVLDQDSFKPGGVFRKLVRLLRNSLKNSKYNHPRMFSMFRSKTFQTDCIDKITVIDDSRYDDPGVVNRMELFFISTAISRKYFQGVINAVTRDSDEDLSILIDMATVQCCINSKFKDPVDSSTVQQSNDKIPVTETIQTPPNSVETNQNRFIGNNPNETYQQIPVLSVGPTIVYAAVEPQILTRVVPIKANNSMIQFTTLSSEAVTSTPTTGLKVPCKPSPLFKKSVPNIHLYNAVGSTVVIDNNKYTLTKDPSGQLQAVLEANSSNILVQSPSTADIKCIAKNCKNSVNMMCKRCQIAKYCDSKCQKRY